MEGAYMRNIYGYSILETETDSRHQGRFIISWWRGEGCQPEGAMNYCPNVVIFTITVGWICWYVVGAYVSPNN